VIDLYVATCARKPDLDERERILLPALDRQGIAWAIRDWRDPWVDWAAAPVLLRCTWDYAEHEAEFLAWCERVDRDGTLWNPWQVVRWNTSKRYLRALEEAGVPVVPTRWLGADDDLGAVLAETGWARWVLKPIVGAGARGAMRGGPGDVAAGEGLLRADPRGHLLQPFLDEVPTHGEISVILLEGEPSHAGRKVPKSGDWRAQAEYGGTLSAEPLTPEIVDLARRVLAVVPGITAYARIDLVPHAGRLVVIEAEVVEPALYWNWAPEAADRFAAILKRRLGAR